MLRVLGCVTQEHNLWLLFLAALICAITSTSAFLLLSRTGVRTGVVRRMWGIGAGVIAGLGVWATHFVAMTAYDVGVPLSFAPAPLFGSLALSLAAQTAAFWLAFKAASLRGKALAGCLSGLGIILMHYLGMTGVDALALMQWDAGYVGASVAMSILFAAGAMLVFFVSTSVWRAVQAGGVLLLAICALHFTAMAALTLTPIGAAEIDPDAISQSMLGVVVGFAVLLCLIAALAAGFADIYLSDRQRLENIRLRDTVAMRTAELEALAKRQQELTQRAEDASEARAQFLADMSHELRTPLNAVIGYGEILSEDLEDAGARQDAQRIVTAGQHLLALINDVLDLSKIDAGRVELEEAPFDVAALARETIDTVAPAAVTGDARLRTVLAADLGAGYGDAFKIKQCLLNLLSNAIKFSKGGDVVLNAGRQCADGRDWLVFEVADTGIGMNDAQMARLFQPFVQAEASTMRKFGGTGLGLTITRRFAQLMGGDVTVKSAIGEGSTFTLRLPAPVAEMRHAA
jgi:signal transduction histidine kinase